MNKKSLRILTAVLIAFWGVAITFFTVFLVFHINHAVAESKDKNPSAVITQDPNSQKPKDPNAANDPNSPKKVDHYVGSTEKMKFHTPDCKWVAKIPEASKKIFKTKEEAIAAGMTACKTCNP